MKNHKPSDLVYAFSLLIVCLSVILVMEGLSWGKYVYCIGGSLYLSIRLRHLYRGDDFRLKRLNRLWLFNMVLAVGSAYLMFVNNNSWIIALLLLALVEIYASWRAERYRKQS